MRRPALWIAVAVFAAGACSPAERDAVATPTSVSAPTAVAAPEPNIVAPGPTAVAAAAATPGDRPNVVVFLTDDQTVDQMAAMPQTLALIADRGASFNQSVVNVAVCCPSRATLLTGQHASHHGVLSNRGLRGGFRAFEDQDRTIATALSDAGYATIFAGRYLNGYGLTNELRYVPPGWSDFHALISPTDSLYVEPSFYENGEVVSYGADSYATDVITERALAGIEEAVGRDDPFFALLGYPAPHAQAGVSLAEYDRRTFGALLEERYPDPLLTPALPAPRHVGAFADVGLPDWQSLNEADITDKPEFLRRFALAEDTVDQLTVVWQRGLESLLAVDESVAETIRHIDALGQLDNTFFLFTSDNGLLHGQHRFRNVKYLPYEPSIRVPLLVRGPGVSEGVELSSVVSNVDLAATILDIAEVGPNRAFDGRSLLGLMTGTEAPWGRAVLIQGFEFRRGSPPYVGVHTGDSVYVEWATGAVELYDLTSDPDQLVNLADDERARMLLERDEALLRELEDCVGPNCASVGADVLAVPDPPAAREGQ